MFVKICCNDSSVTLLLYPNSVVEIRERRIKVDESEGSVREQFEELNVTMGQYRQRVNAADREFEKGRRELDIFRKEKQEKQNVLNCAVNLKLHQVRESSHIAEPLDLSVFYVTV